ncbi:GATOR complex protein Iml1 isoform X2 [Schistocerca gregaria]|uniref:GATOR complex protein Iml1 isoform X2 n=1 Tax=Schistocerca gregaria TaxID=7010 RepID=UPI00211EE13D|nr:GATOR complex protein Iml1 isoform X2 [Schistocerca gregaria]
MKLFKLIVHHKSFSGEDLIINPKDFPGIKQGSVVEIYLPEDEFSRLLLQVTSFKEDMQSKDTISVEQSIATAFQLRTYADVCVNIVNPADVALDSVELTFKDQYLGRSEMWRLKNSLVDTCVYVNKKIEFCGGTIRCQVYEMWSMGDRVACGVITNDTKVVFRSSTSMVYLFIQMSSEMWDFDIHGDLYFEKAVNGFLADLFQKWKKNGSNHEVTIVLFSRTFYRANSLEEFPSYMNECLQQDYKGRFYEDFYRVAVQNERYEDWTNTLVQLRRLFTDYQKIVLEYHKRPGEHVPKAVNSTAAQGNFLEVLNMSLNVFEKHYLDRSFDRTGQLSVVITPGVGVFEVDRELTNVTKQRIIDNGVGSDLVCVGEQPLHAVPLLKFHNKDTLFSAGDDYSMPHWINLSFYSTNKKVAYSNFIPRIKLPPKRSKPLPVSNNGLIQAAKSKLLQEDDCMPNSLFDYDAYDAQVFQLPPVHTARFSRSLQRMNSRTRRSGTLDTQSSSGQKTVSRKMSDPDIHHSGGDIGSPTGSSAPRSAAISIPYHHSSHASSPQQSSGNAESLKQKAFAIQSETQEAETSPPVRPVVGSAGSPSNMPQGQVNFPRTGRALINPFDPSHVTIKLTSNRRRWTHIFPKGPTGVLIQQHHYQAVPTIPASDQPIFDGTATLSSSPQNENSSSSSVSRPLQRSSSQVAFQDNVKIPGSVRPNLLSSGTSERRMPANKSLILLWGATGEQEWTPALTTGVDWKSLTIPACLPITTDYFPDKRSLQNDYVVSDYTLLPDDVNADFAQQRAIYRKPLTTPEVFRELVSQRLAQGFQLIVLNNQVTSKQVQTPGNNATPVSAGISSVVMTRTTDTIKTEEHFLSIGRMFHKISLCGSAITVTRYRPRHPYHPFKVHYRYRFHAPHHDTYEISWVSFTTEKLETYNWNYLDHYICTRGDVDFALVEALKYWRFRVYLLPLNHQATKKILDGAENCDIYAPLSTEEQGHFVEGFLRFIETWVNKVKRPNTHKKPRSPVSAGNKAHHRLILRRHSASTIFLSHNNTSSSNLVTASGLQTTNLQTSVVGNSPFRERLGSNRVLEKPRPRSGSKVMERIKAEGMNTSGRISPASEAAVNENKNIFPQAFAYESSVESQDNADDSVNQTVTHRLKSNASIQEILDAMKNVQTGIGFLTNHPSLPSNTFVSADAVQWLINHVEGINHEEKAVNLLTNMLNEKMICHASGDFRHPIIIGFYLYHIVQQEKDLKDGDYVRPIGDLPSFENEWLEVEVKHPAGWHQEQLTSPTSEPSSSTTPKFLLDELDKCCHYHGDNNNAWSVPLYKHTHLETDVNNKSDRIEWGHARYQSVFRPNRAYELVVQWVASSGTIVAELIQGWSRKAPTCGFQMVPIPADTISLPFTDKSDPLRGPIFVTLNTECLLGSRNFLFEEYPVETWKQRLFLFQESIIERFGFIHCASEGHNNNSLATDSGGVSHHNIYVHVTGNVFILIPSQHCQHTHSQGEPALQTNSRASSGGKQQLNQEGKRYPVHSESASSPHESYITRHVSEKYNKDIGSDLRVGFLWSWNHMVSRRWKSSSTPATGDEGFQTKLLRDFRDFCANGNNRLQNYWNSCWLLKK